MTLSRFATAAILLTAIGSAYAAPKPRTLMRPAPKVSPTPQPSPSPILEGRSLSEVFTGAIKRTETIGIQQEILEQTKENVTQAKGALAPTISGSATLYREEQPSDSYTNGPADQRTVKLTLDQPLFRGLRDFAALRQRKDLVNSQKAALQDTSRQLFYQISNAYYNELELQSDEQNYLNEIDINNKRIDELRGYVKIGRSPVTDLLTFQVNASSLEAQLEATRGQIEAAKDLLAYVTGWSRDTPLVDKEPGTDTPPNLTEYLARVDQRPDVQIAVANRAAAEEYLPIARGGHLPSLDLLGDYYLERPSGPLNSVNWDVELALTVPIFQGGIVQSQVRQASSQARQATLVESQTRRAAEQEVRTFHDALASDLKQESKLEETVILSKKNYEAELHDYRSGLVNNLEVMTAVTAYQDSQRQLDRQKYLVKLDWTKLQAATAQRPEIVIPDRDDK